MPHIHTEPGQYDHTASAFIVRLGKEPRLILHIHKYVGTFIHFGGHIEHDESPWQSLVREIKEESGYDITQLKILQPKDSLRKIGDLVIHPLPFMHVSYHYQELDHHHSDLKYVFVTEQEPEHKPGTGESEIIRSFTRDEILELSKDQIKDYDREICLYVLDTVLKDWEPVDPFTYQF